MTGLKRFIASVRFPLILTLEPYLLSRRAPLKDALQHVNQSRCSVFNGVARRSERVVPPVGCGGGYVGCGVGGDGVGGQGGRVGGHGS